MIRGRRNQDRQWYEEISQIEQLNWRKNPRDFVRLYRHVLKIFEQRDGIKRDQLFRLIKQQEFRKMVKMCAEECPKNSRSVVFYIYMRIKSLELPAAIKERSSRRKGG